MEIKLTIKGEAVLIAIETGLIRKTPEGYDEEPFERFWEELEQVAVISKKIKEPFDNGEIVFKENAGDCTEQAKYGTG